MRHQDPGVKKASLGRLFVCIASTSSSSCCTRFSSLGLLTVLLNVLTHHDYHVDVSVPVVNVGQVLGMSHLTTARTAWKFDPKITKI